MEAITTFWIKDVPQFATHKDMQSAVNALKAMKDASELPPEEWTPPEGCDWVESGPLPAFPQFEKATDVNGAIRFRESAGPFMTETEVFAQSEMAMRRVGAGWLNLAQQILHQEKKKNV